MRKRKRYKKRYKRAKVKRSETKETSMDNVVFCSNETCNWDCNDKLVCKDKIAVCDGNVKYCNVVCNSADGCGSGFALHSFALETNIYCNVTSSCKNTEFHCDNSNQEAKCLLTCKDRYSCEGISMECKGDLNCEINVARYDSFKNKPSLIECDIGVNNSCNINCGDNIYYCESIQLNCINQNCYCFGTNIACQHLNIQYVNTPPSMYVS